MAHSMLIVIAMPDFQATVDVDYQKWRSFIGNADLKIAPMQGVERLSENVWLVNLRIDPTPLILLGNGAQQFGFGFRLLPFDDAPQWLPGGNTTSHKS
jgi:hypothetical protein